MSAAAPDALAGQRVIAGPETIRSERWWRIEATDGRRLALAQLLPELARDEALRRRYVHDATRRAALAGDHLAEVIAIGPEPDPLAPEAEPPWRLRVDPGGEPLDQILARRAPLPVDEAIGLVAEIADAVGEVHDQGAVLRDLEPRNIAVTDSGVVLTDIGLARLTILSSRSASSLMLESSPYAAPEHLRATVLDRRADLYTLGVILWQAITGVLPLADQTSIFGDRAPLPPLSSLGIEAPEGLDALLDACLAGDPERRPESAREIAEALRGDTDYSALRGESLALARLVCQACGEPMRPGLRLCLACGKQAVQFEHAGDDADKRFQVQLLKASEETDFVANLRAFFETVGDRVPELNFLTGDTRMYSRAERARLHKVPAPLVGDLDRETAEALAERLSAEGFKVKVVEQVRRPRFVRTMVYGGLTAAIAGPIIAGVGSAVLGLGLMVAGATSLITGLVRSNRYRRVKGPVLAGLRPSPAALPASDPLIARIGAVLDDRELAADVRERVGEIALLVQRLVDHRAATADADIERIAEPVEPIVGLVEREVERITACDRALVDLDEGTLVRAIAASEARAEPRSRRAELYAGLDRLRELEETRARHMMQLLEAASLMRRITNLGLGLRDQEAEHQRLLAIAEASLDD